MAHILIFNFALPFHLQRAVRLVAELLMLLDIANNYFPVCLVVLPVAD